MQEINITKDLACNIHRGIAVPFRAITTRELNDSKVFLVGDGLRLALADVTVRRKKISELEKDDIFKCRIGKNAQDVISFLEETGQFATPETTISIVDWERFEPASNPVASVQQSARPIESEHVFDDMPHIALAKMLVPLADAQDEDVVAISLPYYKAGVASYDDEASTSDFFVLVKRHGQITMQTLSQCSQDLIARYQAWLSYGVQENDWNLSLGKEACNHLTAYLGEPFTATALFFTDCVVAVSTTERKLLSVALPSSPTAGSSPDPLTEIPSAMATELEKWNIWPAAPEGSECAA